MEIMDAWAQFMQTGNVLDYLRYSAIRDSKEYFEPQPRTTNGNDTAKKEDNRGFF